MSALSPTTARRSGSIRTTPMHCSIEVSTRDEKATKLAPKPIWRRPNASTRTLASKRALVSVRRVVESYESFVIQGWRA